MSIISLKDVSFAYEGQTSKAVDAVSFNVEPGEFVAILGANGSGKSTLCKLINALYQPTEGFVSVDGILPRDDDTIYQARRACGMVFQNPDNQVVATIVEEDVAFGLENLGVPSDEIRRRVDEALEAVDMSAYARSAPHMLSGGQKQRIAIAGVLAMLPKVIIFDESTAMLDPAGRAEIFALVRQLSHEKGLTILWVTHFMEEAAQADRVIVIDSGRVRADDTPRRIFRDTALLLECGLDAPDMTLICQDLRAHGVDIPSDILTVEEMVVELCRLKSES